MMSPPPSKSIKPVLTAGFTLIELSVVLVIIGLIVGGVLVGQSLIQAAQIRGTITAMDRYKTAYNTFLSKYNCVPGDCANASNFGLGACCPSTGFAGNGDGDGYIYTYDDGYNLPDGHTAGIEEGWDALVHLYNAGLIQDNINWHSAKANLPISNGFMFFTSLRPNSPPAGYVMPDKQTNYLYIGTYPGNGQDLGNTPPILTPDQARSIDQKIDDGLPMSGSVRASYANAGSNCSGGPCFNLPAEYVNGGNGPASCVDDRVTPPVYMFNGWSSGWITGFCSIHVPVN